MKKDTIPESNVKPTIQPTDTVVKNVEQKVESHKDVNQEVGTLEKLLNLIKLMSNK